MLSVLRPSSCCRSIHLPRKFPSTLQSVRYYGSDAAKPLRILFCGSDEFSNASLTALYHQSKRDPNEKLIESIDVVCRPGKWTGPSRKIYKEVSLISRAKGLRLPLHTIDTFTGWTPPSVDLVIAVSFGLLVPKRIIEGAKYGGLNVHPSLLPDLYGPAPLLHALLDGDTHTGITVQTLHPTKMDGGQIVAQTPFPGTLIPSPETITELALRGFTGKLGAEMLIEVLRENKFKSPIQDLTPQATESLKKLGYPPRHAGKLGIEARHVDWNSWTSDRILRASRFMGPLWNNISVFSTKNRQMPGYKSHKLVFSNGLDLVSSGVFDSSLGQGQIQPDVKAGYPYMFSDGAAWFINTIDGNTLCARHLTVSGGPKLQIPYATRRYSLMNKAQYMGGDEVPCFISKNPLT